MTYTDAEIIQTARDIVAEFGADYIHPDTLPFSVSCHYAEDADTPSCIVGHIINRLDPIMFRKIAADATLNYGMSANQLRYWGFDASGAQGLALNEAQFMQDLGETWGSALAKLEKALS